jgi:hypothetical protein
VENIPELLGNLRRDFPYTAAAMGRDSQRKASIRKPAHLPARDRNSIDRDHTSHLITALRRSSPCTPSVEPERDGSPRKPSELPAPEREARDRLAVELHLNGYTYSEIAGTLGVANKSVAYKMVQRGLNSAPESSSEQLGLELLRLEFLLDELERRLELEDPAGPGYWSVERNLSPALRLFWQLSESPATGRLRDDLPESLPTIDYFDFIALRSREEHAGAVIHSSHRALRTGRRTAGSAGWSTGGQARRDHQAVGLREGGMTYDQIATELRLANRSVAQKMVKRGSHQSDGDAEPVLAKQLDLLRREQLNLLHAIMVRDCPSREWGQLARRYLALTRRRCKLLELFPDKHRKLRSFGTGPLPDGLRAERDQTCWILMEWRIRTRPGPAEAAEIIRQVLKRRTAVSAN